MFQEKLPRQAFLAKANGKRPQSDDLELDGPIEFRILDGIAWDFTKRNDGGDDREGWWVNLELLPSQPSRKRGNEERRGKIGIEIGHEFWPKKKRY